MQLSFPIFTPSIKPVRQPVKPKTKHLGFYLTDRDIQIMKAVYDYRGLTTNQIMALFFQPDKGQDHATKAGRCWHRLKFLAGKNYLLRHEQLQYYSEGKKPFLYQLGEEGAKLLPKQFPDEYVTFDWQPDRVITPHTIANNDVRIAFTLGAVSPLTIAVWKDEATLKADHQQDTFLLPNPNGRNAKARVEPDDYFLLLNGSYPYHCFIETDLGTVAGQRSHWWERDWSRKVRAYLVYYTSGLYTKRYNTHGWRVLTVTISERRLANMKAVTEKVGGKSRFWFTTFDRLHPSTVYRQPIWSVASKPQPQRLLWEQPQQTA